MNWKLSTKSLTPLGIHFHTDVKFFFLVQRNGRGRCRVQTCKLHLKDDLECFAIYWAIAYNICTPPPPPGCEDVPFLLTPETPEDWIKLHLPLKTFIKHWSLPWNMGLPLKNMVLPLKNFMKIKASPQRIAFVYSTSVKESSSYFYCIPLKEFHCPQLGGGTDIKI